MRKLFPLATAACALLANTAAYAQQAGGPPTQQDGEQTSSPAAPPPADQGNTVRAPGAPGQAAASPNNPASAQSNGFPPEAIGFGARLGPRYAVSRWAEDWSFLRDTAKRKDPFDLLKFIPLDEDGSTYLTLSGQERLRVETSGNPGLRDVRLQDRELIRTFVGADLHIGEHVRFYGELASGQQFGRAPMNPNERNDLYVQQLFGEVRGRVAGADAGVIFGRQHFLDGPIQLVSTRENNNIHTTLQGVRAYANWKRVRVDLFDLRFVDLGLDAFDDNVSDSTHFRGGLVSMVLTPEAARRPLFLDAFFYNSTDDNRRWGVRTGHEERNYYGLRAHGTLGPASIDWTGTYQSGNYETRQLRGWSVYLNQSISLSSKGWRPAVGVHFDAGSGGGAFGNGTLHNADFLFGVNPYLNDSTAFGFINLMDVSPTLTFTPAPKVTVRTEYDFLRRLNQNDAVYSGTKAAYAGTQFVAGHDVGQQARLRIAWAVNPHITLAATLEHVLAGDVLREAGFHDSTYTASQIVFKF